MSDYRSVEVKLTAEELISMGSCCDDCKRPYGDEHGFPDLIVSNDVWRRISPKKDLGGLLCPSCICKRLHDAGIIDAAGSFFSGPIRCVDYQTMYNSRWIENILEEKDREKNEANRST